jgi:glycosyltransferase involved in cell wall biosynthesis
LFGAAYETSRKGGDLFLKALEELGGRSDIVALCFGKTDIKKEFSVPVCHLGELAEDELRLLYSMADLSVVPSREDNLPNIAVESSASGTPCVTFDVGGLPDIIKHHETGYLADPFDTIDLSDGIKWILNDTSRLRRLSSCSRKFTREKFNISKISNSYRNLYNDLVSSDN